MASLEMDGPYSLDEKSINQVITKGSAGNYALGCKNKEGAFLVDYVGRSDTDVGDRVKSWVNISDQPLFKFSYATSPKGAFEKECANYHDFSPPRNNTHPDRPKDTNWSCPRCKIFD